MKCSYCGKNNKPGALVCKRCGIALPVQPPVKDEFKSTGNDMVELGTVIQDTPPIDDKPAKKLRLSRKSALVATLAVLGVLLVIALVIVVAVNSSGIILPSRNSYTVVDGGVFYNGEPVDPVGSGVASAVTNPAGTTVALLTKSGELYSLRSGVNSLAARNAVSYTVSVNGSRIVYTDGDGLLWSFSSSDPASAPECICNDAVGSGFSVSPDGKSVLFVKASDNTLYANVGGKLRSVGEGFVPLSISDGGKHIYCYSPRDNSFNYVNKRGTVSFLRSNNTETVYLNSRHDELVFFTDSGNGAIFSLICSGAGEIKEIANSDTGLTPVIPVSGICITDTVSDFTVITCPFKSFDKKVFSGRGLIYYESASGSTVYSVKEVSFASASDNYSTVLYTAEGFLYRKSVRSSADPELVCGNVSSIKISANGRMVWYTDTNQALHCLSGSSDTMIAPQVSEYAVIPSGRSAVFISTGQLCCNRNGKARQTYLYEGLTATDVIADAGGLYYRTNLEGWQKLANGGKRTDLSK